MNVYEGHHPHDHYHLNYDIIIVIFIIIITITSPSSLSPSYLYSQSFEELYFISQALSKSSNKYLWDFTVCLTFSHLILLWKLHREKKTSANYRFCGFTHSCGGIMRVSYQTSGTALWPPVSGWAVPIR